MPRLVADSIPWHTSAAIVCVGQSEQPRPLEWELRSGASLAVIDSGPTLQYHALHPRPTDEGDRTGSDCHPVSFVRKVIGAKPDFIDCPTHNLGTNQKIWSLRPRLKSAKNWSPDPDRGSRLSFEWIASGLTVVCFWTAPSHWVSGLEGPVRFRFALDSTLARLSPNRCLDGPPGPSCSTEN